MGCGSSKSAVAVVDNNNKPQNSTTNIKKKSETPSLDHFQVNSSKSNINQNSRPPSANGSINSLTDLNNNKNKLNKSRQDIRKPSTAGSLKSGDSGVYDDVDRLSSAKSHKSSQSVSSKPSSGTKSSARKRLLRIDDQALEESKDVNTTTSEMNMVSRPKTRFGNVAFDLMIDAPETGNMKKRPERLQAIETKKKRSKKVKTKEEIDKKMHEVEERRKQQELEKQMKAKQFQHHAIHTAVQPFSTEEENGEIEVKSLSS